MRSSTVVISAIIIGALIGGATMGIPSIRQKLLPHNTTTTTTAEAAAPAAATPTQTATAAPTAEAENKITPAAGFDVKEALKDRVLGDPNAPVTFYDYSSLSCPHCADFHTNVLVQIKRDYIDTGKVKMVFRPFPLNKPAMLGEQIARCVPESEYFAVLDLLFSSQDKWVFGENDQNLRQIVKVAGVNDAQFDACIANKELADGIVKIAQDGSDRFKIKGTPTFIIGADDPKLGEVLTGEATYETFSDKFDQLLTAQMIETPKKTLSIKTPTPAN